MKLSDSSRQNLEEFFREYLQDENFNLPEIYLYAGKFTRILTKLINVHGLAVGRRIYIAPHFVSLNSKNLKYLPADLAAHEIAHTLQYKREGLIKFLYKYVSEYRKNLQKFDEQNARTKQQAYLDISFEIEAREVAAKFIEWRKNKRREF